MVLRMTDCIGLWHSCIDVMGLDVSLLQCPSVLAGVYHSRPWHLLKMGVAEDHWHCFQTRVSG